MKYQRLNNVHLKHLVLLSMLCVVSACGFQLRGALELSDDIAPIYLQQNNAFELAREIKALLLSNKVSVAEKVKQSKTQLVLIKEKRARRILSVDSNGRAREYLLTYTINFSIQINRSSDKPEVIEDSFTLSRSLLFDPNAVLAVTNESDVLYKEMRRDAARKILLKLQAEVATSNNNTDVKASTTAQ